ncbi:MAG: outer membrane lipid asymmetry maintenance protein MlaD [Pseudomonadota bacterium]
MRSQNIELAVGLFVLAAIAALLMLSIRVAGLSDITSGKNGYLVTSDFSNIGGLKVRSRVSIAGVPIGRVTNIVLDQSTFTARVTMMIDIDANHIPDDSQASILTSGLLGDNYVGFTPGFSDKMLVTGSHVPLENTNSALVLEQLIAHFMANQASQAPKSDKPSSEGN